MDEGAWWATVCGVAKSHTTERLTHTCITSFPGGTVGKNPPASALGAGDVGLILGLGKFPWRRRRQPIAVFLPGKFHGQKEPGEV